MFKKIAEALWVAGMLCVGWVASACTGDTEPAQNEIVEAMTARGPFPQLDAAGGDPETAFAVDLSTAVNARDAQGAPIQVHGYQLAGTWQLVPTQAASNEARDRWILARLQLTKFELGYEPRGILSKTEHETYLRAQLQRPVLFRIDRQGAVVALKAPDDLSAVALGALKALAAHFQFAAAASSASSEWQSLELDTVGEYEALYSRPSGQQLVRKKSQYSRLARQGALQLPGADAPLGVQGEDRFTSDTSGQIVAIAGNESLRFAANQLLPELLSETEFSAHRVNASADALSRAEAEALSALPAREFFAEPPAAAHRFEIDIAKVAELRSVADALRRLDTFASEASPEAAAAARRLELGLGALIRVSPSAEDEAWSLLASTPSKAERLRLVLAQSPRAESQLRLVQILSGQAPNQGALLPAEEQSRLLVSLAENPSPSKLLLDGLVELRKTTTLRDSVLMGIGGVCHEALASNPALALDALGELEVELAAAESGAPEKLAIVLRALGNTGHPRVLPRAQPYLEHSSDVVRAAAVRALRRIEDPRVDSELERMRTADSSASVQTAVLAVQEQRRQRNLGRIR